MKILEMLAPLWDTLKTILPLALLLSIFQVIILKKPIENIGQFIIGILLTSLGLHLFLKGSNMSLIPMGDSVGRNLHIINNKWIIIAIGFAVGYFGTLVEPALKILAMEVEEVSAGAINNRVLIQGVAIGFGIGMALGLFRIISDISYIKILLPMLIVIGVLAVMTPAPYDAIAMDSASATTGPVNIPINMAIAVGLASIIETADPLLAGFGVVGLTSLGAMISVMILGIMTKF